MITRIVKILFLIGLFPNFTFGEAVRFIPDNKPFFGPAKFGHVILDASGKQVKVVTDQNTIFVHREDKGWCVEDMQRNRTCHNQIPKNAQITITEDATGARVGSSGMGRDWLWIRDQNGLARLLFEYRKNQGYPNNGGPYTVTTVKYSDPNGALREIRYVQKTDAVYRCVSPIRDENFLKTNVVKEAGCH